MSAKRPARSRPEETPKAGAGLPTRREVGAAMTIDAIIVVFFGLMGRSSHNESLGILSVLVTIAPFLIAAALGWALSRGWRRPLELKTTGISLVIMTVVVGVALRQLFGQGTSGLFPVVTLVYFAVTMLGWRAIAQWSARRATTTKS